MVRDVPDRFVSSAALGEIGDGADICSGCARARPRGRRGSDELRAVMAAFSFFNSDSGNIRNIPEAGSGALMDIGCRAIQISRFLFGVEPKIVAAMLDRDPEMGIDRLSSAMLEFQNGQSVFTTSLQLRAVPESADRRNQGRLSEMLN